jgi:hypothetical protein
LSSIPSTAQIVDARLIINVQDVSGASLPFALFAYKINSDWQENTETWLTHNGGDFENQSRGGAYINSTGGWTLFLDTNLIQGWVNGSIPNYGILLKQNPENTVNDYITIYLKEISEENQRPYLEVKFIN